jgi:predicted nucleic acid-binding protein
MDRMNTINPEERYVEICRSYFPKDEYSDIIHAATCLQTGAILITNDKHFDRVKEKRIIKVWSIAEAIEEIHNV